MVDRHPDGRTGAGRARAGAAARDRRARIRAAPRSGLELRRPEPRRGRGPAQAGDDAVLHPGPDGGAGEAQLRRCPHRESRATGPPRQSRRPHGHVPGAEGPRAAVRAQAGRHDRRGRQRGRPHRTGRNARPSDSDPVSGHQRSGGRRLRPVARPPGRVHHRGEPPGSARQRQAPRAVQGDAARAAPRHHAAQIGLSTVRAEPRRRPVGRGTTERRDPRLGGGQSRRAQGDAREAHAGHRRRHHDPSGLAGDQQPGPDHPGQHRAPRADLRPAGFHGRLWRARELRAERPPGRRARRAVHRQDRKRGEARRPSGRAGRSALLRQSQGRQLPRAHGAARGAPPSGSS